MAMNTWVMLSFLALIGGTAAACQTSKDCPSRQVCLLSDCRTSGKCVDRPDMCIQMYEPVCGCDGKTYANECIANSYGISMAHAGECVGNPLRFGRVPCKMNEECGNSEFCNLETHCGELAQLGTCEEKPEMCMSLFEPVCGCDRQTYDNECSANSNGVSMRSPGVC